jgi:hypothetical protein
VARRPRIPERSTDALEDEGFLSRWSRRKLDAGETRDLDPAPGVDPEATPAASHLTAETEPTEPPSDHTMPPLESLQEDSDLSGFFSPRVSEQLRRLALRKVFHTARFNVVDGLDDYAEDYNKFEALGDIITADMRLQMERAMERAKASLDERQTPESQSSVESEAQSAPAQGAVESDPAATGTGAEVAAQTAGKDAGLTDGERHHSESPSGNTTNNHKGTKDTKTRS